MTRIPEVFFPTSDSGKIIFGHQGLALMYSGSRLSVCYPSRALQNPSQLLVILNEIAP